MMFHIQINLEHCLFNILTPVLKNFVLKEWPNHTTTNPDLKDDPQYYMDILDQARRSQDTKVPQFFSPHDLYLWNNTRNGRNTICHVKLEDLRDDWKSYLHGFSFACTWLGEKAAASKIDKIISKMCNLYREKFQWLKK